ncbi:flagellar protein FliO/FliZ [Roseovarius sp. MBR-51]
MELLTPERILTLAGFLGVLVLIWAAVRLNRAPLAARFGAGRTLEVAETLSLGGDARAILLRAEGQSVLVVMGRRSGTALTLLPMGPVVEDVA